MSAISVSERIEEASPHIMSPRTKARMAGWFLSGHDIDGKLHSTIHLPSCLLWRRRGHGGQHPVARIGLSTWVRRLPGRIGVRDHDDRAYV